MFALVDANAFYCSAEQVFRPDWRNKPVIVLSNNDGCIVAANKQAKAAGIQKFIPYFHVKTLCEQKRIIVCSSNYELYADLSAKMMQIIGRFAPEQHIYSIDESFLSFKHSEKAINSFVHQGQLIRKTVWKEARLPVCVGIANTLTLAKVANHAAKKIIGYQGVCVIDNDAERIAILKKLAVSDVWGIGRKLTKKLTSLNIQTAYDLSQMAPGMARKQFNIDVERTVRELNGQECKEWGEARADKKQIFSTRSVGERITDYELLLQALSTHVAIAAEKARRQQSYCKSMLIFAHNSPYDDNPRSFKLVLHFVIPTHCTVELTRAISEAAPKLFRQGVRYYKIGVGLIDLVSCHFTQLDLFNTQTSNPELMRALDSINGRYGRSTLFMAAQGIEQKWAMRRHYLTPQYTTNWKCLPKIHC
ncbi:Y-family DNA polymerase [Shewanella gaetbuli]|uniref:Y-family DNA polymerase n=1 Tax=Shewanella gaetbuli TaxID=220752 RepID=A0A9X2CJX2_9GAMM|nr:Y-family DNA polymerase [Shewanella gaetbuli]MCL1142501.1 Y-family DNA polymerase [Shewanella gaetbuli]